MVTLAEKRAGIAEAIAEGAATPGGPAPATPAEAGAAADPLRIGAVVLAVRDIGRVEAFYREVIGLEPVGRSAGSVRLGAGGVGFLELIHRPEAKPDDPAAAGLFHTAFLLPSRADLARWLVHAGRLGVPLDGASDHLVSEAVYLSDPEGNGIEVYADRPRAAWRWTDGQVEMATRPLDIRGLLRDAGDAAPWNGAPAGARIGHVHLRVGDAAEAARFYGGTLGLDVVRRGPQAAFLSSGGYHHHIAANTWRSAGAGRRDPAMAGLEEVAFAASGDGVLDGIAGRLGASGRIAAEEGTLRFPDPWGTALRVRRA